MSFTDNSPMSPLAGVLARIGQIEQGPDIPMSAGGTDFDSVMQQVAAPSGTPGETNGPGSTSGAVDLTGSFGWPLEEDQVLSPSQLTSFGPGGASAGAPSPAAKPVNGYVLDTGSGPTTSFDVLPASAGVGQPTANILSSGLSSPDDTAQAPTGAGTNVVADARKYLGVPYLWGGTDPAVGLDCSGLVQRVFKDLGVSLPRVADQQSGVGTPVASLADAQPGDLVFFAGSDGTATDPGHVGIYVGNGQMIDAPYTGTVVRQEAVADAGPVIAIRRVLPATTTINGTQALTPSSYDPQFAAATVSESLPPNLLSAVAQTESGMDPNAVSSAGAEGLMQLMPATAASLGVDPFDPTQAIKGAAQLLSSLYQQFGSWPLAIAAYNAGPAAVTQYGGIPPYPQTQAYVQKVLTRAGMEA